MHTKQWTATHVYLNSMIHIIVQQQTKNKTKQIHYQSLDFVVDQTPMQFLMRIIPFYLEIPNIMILIGLFSLIILDQKVYKIIILINLHLIFCKILIQLIIISTKAIKIIFTSNITK